eukprot:6491976-Amphidinium_carterae.4
MHQTVEAGPEAAPPDNANQKPSLCQTPCICPCSAAGKEVVRFHKSLQKFQKARFCEPKEKDLLAKGFVVLCLQSVCPPGDVVLDFHFLRSACLKLSAQIAHSNFETSLLNGSRCFNDLAR